MHIARHARRPGGANAATASAVLLGSLVLLITMGSWSYQEYHAIRMAPVRDGLGQFQGGVIGLVPLTGLEDISNRLGRRFPLSAEFGTIESQLLAPDGELVLDSDLRQAGLLNLARLELPSAVEVTSGDSGAPGFMEELHLRWHIPVLTDYARLNRSVHAAVLLRIDRSAVVGPLRSEIWQRPS
jgi:hypothetical protein